jgi:hypothetical protein
MGLDIFHPVFQKDFSSPYMYVRFNLSPSEHIVNPEAHLSKSGSHKHRPNPFSPKFIKTASSLKQFSPPL